MRISKLLVPGLAEINFKKHYLKCVITNSSHVAVYECVLMFWRLSPCCQYHERQHLKGGNQV